MRGFVKYLWCSIRRPIWSAAALRAGETGAPEYPLVGRAGTNGEILTGILFNRVDTKAEAGVAILIMVNGAVGTDSMVSFYHCLPPKEEL